MPSILNNLRKHLRPGQVYRRAEMEQWSNAIDRHLHQLQKDGTLTKLSAGVYYCPKKTAFGNAPAEDDKLVKAFLKDHRYLVTSPNAYNALGLGTTQLYNETVVYNHKRHGLFKLGGRTFDFRVKPYFPTKMTKEFLLVDLVNNLGSLAEDTEKLLKRVRQKARSMNVGRLSRLARDYGSVKTKKFFREVLSEINTTHVA